MKGINRQYLGITHQCGGQIAFEDMRGKASKEYRYEAFCAKCQECDPNGYATIRELKREAKSFWTQITRNP